MFKVKVKKIRPDSKIPERTTEESSGYDVYASVVLDKDTGEVISDLSEPVEIKPGENVLFGIGISLEIPKTHHATIISRSGLASKYNVEVGNPGAPIDSDYRGEITVLLRNLGKESFVVDKGMRIAQIIFVKKETPLLEEADKLSETKRGVGGRGSTGLY